MVYIIVKKGSKKHTGRPAQSYAGYGFTRQDKQDISVQSADALAKSMGLPDNKNFAGGRK